MDKILLQKAGDIWKELGQHKKPITLKIEIEIYKKMLTLFQVGDYCYLIFCPPQLQIEYLSPSIQDLTGYTEQEFSVDLFLESIHPDDIDNYLSFEKYITDFWKLLPPQKATKYKTRYDFRFRCKNGEYKRLLQQVIVIQSDETGAVLRTFVIYTDISEFKQTNKMVLSIIGLEGEPSYIDIQPVEKLMPYQKKLTKRETEVFHLLVQEYETSEIAEKLHISPHTVSVHRKNILSKTQTSSVLQLVKLGLEKGWI